MVELFLRFLVVGATAFGGGGTALPLVERITVAETGWLTPQQFAIGVGFAYATPGPILILAAFVGYHVAGIAGALVGTVGVFAIPVILAAGSAGVVAQLKRHARFRVFGRFAAAAAVGLLAVTLVTLARPVVELHPGLLAGSVLVFAAERLGVSPVLLLVIAVGAGAAAGAVGWFA
ncbi:MAG TPA: chromate transporter [Burkholderiales bacterium]|nr:chromate transporter [Burkholderiales bacterium]